MDAELKPFKVWLGFIAAGAFFLLMGIVPSEQKIRVEFYYDRAAERFIQKPVEDVSEMHPLMALPVLFLAAGWAWWFFWLYRRHEQLARLTNSTYPIGSKYAVGFHFIPGYNLYWAFHWTRPFTHLCDLVESGLIKPVPPPRPREPGKAWDHPSQRLEPGFGRGPTGLASRRVLESGDAGGQWSVHPPKLCAEDF